MNLRRRVVVATACDSAYQAAIALRRAEVEVPVVIDLRPDLSPAAQEAQAMGIDVMAGMRVAATHGPGCSSHVLASFRWAWTSRQAPS